MLTYSFSTTGNDSLYEQLYKYIKKDITDGNIIPGTKLPSKRMLAKNLNISTITVENAYGQLIAEGYIYSEPKKGYFVSDIVPGAKSYISNISSNKRTSKPSISNNDSSKQSADISGDARKLFADFISNRTIYSNFPFATWAKLMREVMNEQSELLLTNPPAGGILALRNAIAEHLYQFRGMNVSAEQIIIGAGTEYLYGLIIQLLGRDKIFAMEDPGYKKIAQVYDSNNVDCRYIPLDKNGISIDMLSESDADIIHISPSHHYPTGIVTPISRRNELLEWANAGSGRYIIEDDYDCEFRMSGKPIPTLQSIDTYDKVIYMNTFTKSLSSTIRISYMVLPVGLVPLYYKKLGFYSCTVSNFEQLTLYKFMYEGYFEKHINRMRNFYKNQRNLILNTIKSSPLNDVCEIKEQNSGLHFLMKADTCFSDEELLKRAAELGIGIGFLSQYYHDKDSAAEHTLVINYSGIEPEKIPRAIELLSKSIIR